MLNRVIKTRTAALTLAIMGGTFPFASTQTQIESNVMATNAQPHCVILLHGLIRTPRSMLRLEWELKKQGYQVVNQGYKSRKATIEDLAGPTIEAALSECKLGARIHFVTHSLGGILLRQYLKENSIENLGRSVMMGPPNQGSHIPDEMGDWVGFDLFNGPAGAQLGTDGLPPSLPPVEFEVGIIAGSKSINPLLSNKIPGDDDVKVGVEFTKVEGMADHVTINVSHTYMMNNSEVIGQTLYFLKNGIFIDNSAPADAILVSDD